MPTSFKHIGNNVFETVRCYATYQPITIKLSRTSLVAMQRISQSRTSLVVSYVSITITINYNYVKLQSSHLAPLPNNKFSHYFGSHYLREYPVSRKEDFFGA